MKNQNNTIIASTVTVALALAAGTAAAQQISITVENTSAPGGFAFTPVWVAAHNGGFDSYNGGEPASNFPGLTELAEEGMTGPISTAFAGSNAGLAGGVDTTLLSSTGAPVFTGGESETFSLNVGDTTVNRYFSFASMVVPTNDLFVANGDPFAHELFDVQGNFNGPLVIEIYGRDVNDNGTEVNNVFGGAAFSTEGGIGVDENGVIRDFFTDAGDAAYIASFIGTGTADGGTITSGFGADQLIGRITIVPAPGIPAALGATALLATRRRR